MKRTKIFSLIPIIFLVIGFACRENKPRGHEMSWSPAGDRLAFVSFESNELLVAEFKNEALTKITAIDTCRSTKNYFVAPGWSPDGQYLLFTKMDSSWAEIWLFDWQQKNKVLIAVVPNSEKENRLLVTPMWSPVASQILWGELSGPGKIQLRVARDNSFQSLPISLTGNFLQAEWAADGKSIFYLTKGSPQSRENGLWIMRVSDFSKRKIDSGKNQVQFAVSTKNQIAAIEQIPFEKTNRFRISLIDSLGGTREFIDEQFAKIENICWSADGTRLAWLSEGDSTANIWQWDIFSRRAVRLTFDDAKDLIGWSVGGNLYYTVKYPEFLLKTNPDFSEYREFAHAVQGRRFDDQLIELSHSGRRILEQNVTVFTPFASSRQAAFYQITQSMGLNPEIYCPVVTFSDTKFIFLAVTPAEHSVAAIGFYQKGEFAAALEHLVATSPDFAEIDSSSQPELLKQLKSGDLARKYLSLRKLGQKKQSEFLFQQFIELNFRWIADSGKTDDFFWLIVGVYSQLNEMQSGVQDLEIFLKSDRADSLLKGRTLFAQSVLLAECRNWTLSLEKLSAALHVLPASFSDWDDLQSLLSILIALDSKLKPAQVETAFEQLNRRMPAAGEKKTKFGEMSGDYYQKQGKIQQALAAYQTVDMKNNDLWQKILDLEAK